ncbi:MAG TPA: TPM domain-containing protein [Pseudolabrys sp.]|nr:TPM domain-containing protein [Pseudolabrys sp.]
MSMSAQDRERIGSAIRAAEAKTAGEIVCVLAKSSTDATALPVMIAAVAALALPWLLVAYSAMPVDRILTLQVVAFIVLVMVLSLPSIRAALVPRKARRALAHRAAMAQFAMRGIARTRNRNGILIFVSLAERYARIVADDGIAARVPQTEWQAAVDALTAHMRDGRIADGFIAAITSCGEHLARHFPRGPDDRDELPDKIYVV